IELMTSKVSEDSKINMGRKIYYEIDDIKSGSKLDMKIPFISDSIAHTLVDNKELSEDGNSILNLKVKNEIKRLSDSENKVYRSIKNSGKLAELHPTLTTTNKKTTFSVTDDEREERKKQNIAKYLRNKSADELLKDLSEFNLNEVEKEEVLYAIEKLKESKAIRDIEKKENDLNTILESITKLEASKEYRNLNLTKFLNKITELDLSNITKADSDDTIKEEYIKKINIILSEVDKNIIDELKLKYSGTHLAEISSSLEAVDKSFNSWYFSYNVKKSIDNLKNSIEKELKLNKEGIKKEIATIEDELIRALESENPNTNDRAKEYQFLKGKLFYTVREEEALFELKNTLAQLSERNIYSKLNKISKNEISTYTNIPFEINHALSNKKHYARGGFISGRTVQDNFKGNTSTAYGIYEKEHGKGNKIGLLVGGATTKHNEVYKRTLNTVATESSIKGASAYLGAYYNKELIKNWNWINGIGLQYGKYTINREVKNTYQTLNSKGRANNLASNLYTGLVINYPIHEDVSVQLKGLLSYSAVKQSKVNESGNLALDINSKLYNYLDTELGISFTKVLYGDNMLSSLSAGVYGMAGLSGYKNGNLNAKVDGSSSSFNIKGDKVKKDAVKIFIDYNVQTEEGYNYGLEGTYIANSEENNVKIGVKAGYVF
ncbi:MAG: autotransporter domain-containing protein, partial [Fusobacterium gastrosuis]|uniref:autotransporter domain-containing protein n=1 Tax=Fusobacterium gastrosuis TaxID=1755100 RepID=UPI002A8D92B7|nr:autotransporter domain-containing protein [Fusobacterium gastrosuis]